MINIHDFDVWLFDLDGTILEGSEHFYNQCLIKALKKFDLEIDMKAYPKGMNLEQYLRVFHGGLVSENVQKEIIEEYRKEQKKNTFQAKLFEDAVRFLKKYPHKQKDIVTNCSPATMEIIKKNINLFEYFSVIFDRKPHLLPKPNPDLYLHAAEYLAVSPANCLVFEDSETGIIAAKNANMTVIGIDRENTLSPHIAHQTIDSFDKLL